MKNKMILLAMSALSFLTVSNHSFAQANLEYPGGPTSTMNASDIQSLGTWARNVQMDLSRLETRVEYMADDLEIKNALYTRMKLIAGESGLRPGDLLLRQALYAGIILCDIIEQESIRKNPTPGAVGLQATILKQSLAMAKEYYVSDFVYLNGLLQNRASVQFNDKLVDFGVKLSKFIIKQSTSALGLDATASYGMMKWALGVLNKKLLEDNRNVAFASTIRYLGDSLGPFPDMAAVQDDPAAIEKIRDLKRLSKQVFAEIETTQQSLGH